MHLKFSDHVSNLLADKSDKPLKPLVIEQKSFSNETISELDLNCSFFVDVTISNFQFSNIDLYGNYFDTIIFTNTVFSNTYFRKSELENCQFIDCQFTNCDLTRTDFRNTQLKNCQFTNCNFDQACFNKCWFRELTLKNNCVDTLCGIKNKFYENNKYIDIDLLDSKDIDSLQLEELFAHLNRKD